MSPPLKHLLLLLTFLAVGVGQIVGAQLSYYCASTGQTSHLESCGAACHAGERASHECAEAPNEDKHQDGAPQPEGPAHEHEKVIEKLPGSPSPASLQTPAPILFAVLTDPSPALASSAEGIVWRTIPKNGPPGRRCRPERVRVACTAVMMI